MGTSPKPPLGWRRKKMLEKREGGVWRWTKASSTPPKLQF
jgi:hypothetical protein